MTESQTSPLLVHEFDTHHLDSDVEQKNKNFMDDFIDIGIDLGKFGFSEIISYYITHWFDKREFIRNFILFRWFYENEETTVPIRDILMAFISFYKNVLRERIYDEKKY